MLKEIPWEKFLEWKIFEELEPFPDQRADLNAAHIAQRLWVLGGDAKTYPFGRPLKDFELEFGDSKVIVTAPVIQTVAYQEMLIDSWCFVNNAARAGKKVD